MAQNDFRDFNKQLPKLRIPASVARYPWVTKPQTQHDPEGVYKVEQILDPNVESHAAFIAKVQGIVDDVARKLGKVKAKKMHSPLKEHLDDDGEPTGKVVVTAKTKAVDMEGNPKKLAVVDSMKQDVTKPVFGGSVLVCAVKPSGYDHGGNCGVKLYLNAVQVKQLVSGGNDLDMFDEDEDGYTDEGVPAQATDDLDDDPADADY